MRRWIWSLTVALATGASVVSAQVPDPAKKAEAIKHFEIGLELVKQEAWDSALAEFLRSRELYPTKNALKNAVLCLKELKRFDEALDMVDELIARFGTELSPTEKSTIEDEQKALEKFVGTLTIQTETAGARVVIDGRERGVTPLTKAIRVTVGTRAIVVSKQGYAPFETKVMVSSGESKTVSVKLASIANAGKIRVTETKGRVFDVVVDGVVVGKTPWDGTVSAGPHTIALRGGSDEGTVARLVDVSVEKPTEIALEAVKLPGELRVDPTPADADIFVDGKKVGTGAFKGELPPGKYVLLVSAPWHQDQTSTVTISAGKGEVTAVSLDRIRRLYIEFMPMFNPASQPQWQASGEDNGGTGGLHGAYGLNLRVGYKVHPHFAVELGGGLMVWSDMISVDGVATTSTSGGAGVRGNIIDESVGYVGPNVALSGAAHFGDSFPFTLRAVAGLWRAIAIGKGGKFAGTDAVGTSGFQFPEVQETVTCPFVGYEARMGVRFSRTFIADIGVITHWVRCGELTFGPRTLPNGDSLPPLRTDPSGVIWAPTLGLRWEL